MYPDGIDAVWIGVDQYLNVAAFVTGGSGPIPKVWLDERESILDGEDMVLDLPIIGAATMLCELKRPDDFIYMAQRGLYVFDWMDAYAVRSERKNMYRLVARPEISLFLENAPENTRILISESSFDKVNFREIEQLSMLSFSGEFCEG